MLKGVEGLEGVVRECVVWLVASREDPDSLQQWLLFPFLVLEMTVQRLKKKSHSWEAQQGIILRLKVRMAGF